MADTHFADVRNTRETSSNQHLMNRKNVAKGSDVAKEKDATFSPSSSTPDMYSPLVWSIHEYFDDKQKYLEWVHTPFTYSAKNAKHLAEMGVVDAKKLNMKSPRLFHSDFFESFSNTHW